MLLPQTKRVGFVVLCFCWVTFAANAQQNLEAVSISGTLLMLDDATPPLPLSKSCVMRESLQPH